jgi:hypothetical protein
MITCERVEIAKRCRMALLGPESTGIERIRIGPPRSGQRVRISQRINSRDPAQFEINAAAKARKQAKLEKLVAGGKPYAPAFDRFLDQHVLDMERMSPDESRALTRKILDDPDSVPSLDRQFIQKMMDEKKEAVQLLRKSFSELAPDGSPEYVRLEKRLTRLECHTDLEEIRIEFEDARRRIVGCFNRLTDQEKRWLLSSKIGQRLVALMEG